MARIMVVDDEPGVLRSLRRSIRNMPADTFAGALGVEIFEKPHEALRRAAEHEFDLVISDWRMPLMNGIEFLTSLVRLQPDIARLIVSGYAEFRAEVKAIERLKIFHFISKPWDDDELCALLRLALEHRRQIQESRPLSRRAVRREAKMAEIELRTFAPAAGGRQLLASLLAEHG